MGRGGGHREAGVSESQGGAQPPHPHILPLQPPDWEGIQRKLCLRSGGRRESKQRARRKWILPQGRIRDPHRHCLSPSETTRRQRAPVGWDERILIRKDEIKIPGMGRHQMAVRKDVRCATKASAVPIANPGICDGDRPPPPSRRSRTIDKNTAAQTRRPLR